MTVAIEATGSSQVARPRRWSRWSDRARSGSKSARPIGRRCIPQTTHRTANPRHA